MDNLWDVDSLNIRVGFNNEPNTKLHFLVIDARKGGECTAHLAKDKRLR